MSLLKNSLNDISLETEIQNEKHLLDALGISMSEAASIIGKSRQSLSQADLTSKIDYFRKGDLLSLLIHANSKKSATNLPGAMEYLEATRNPHDIIDLRAAMFPTFLDMESLRVTDDAWYIIPDWLHIRNNHKSATDLLLQDVHDNSSCKRSIFVSNVHDCGMVEMFLNGSKAFVHTEPWMAALPYMIITFPENNPKCFILTGDNFYLHDWYGGARLVSLISTLATNTIKPVPETLKTEYLDA